MIDDFDELASAYLDGQTTNAEADRVETDPDLRSRVAAFGELSRALDTDVEPADPAGRSRHIGAALDAFDALYGADSADGSSPATPTTTTTTTGDESSDGTSPGTSGSAPTTPATTTGDESSPGASDGPLGDETPTTRRLAAVDGDGDRQAGGPASAGPSTFPTWLALAAVLLLVVGGFGVLSQIGGGDDDDGETASVATEAADDSAGSDAVATTESAELAATEEAARDEGENDEMAEDADEAAAVDDEAVEEDSADEDASAEVPAADGEGSAAPSTTTTGGFFPEEAVEGARVLLPSNANPSELASLAEGTVLEAELSSCASDGVFDGEIVLFFVPVLWNGAPGEVLFVEPPSEPRPVLLDSDCQPVP